MKTIKKILLIIAVIIIAVGMFVLGRNGFNYQEGYSRNILLETAKQYILYVSISTAIILIYFAIKYQKQGVIKVLVTSILAIIGTIAFAIAILAISRALVSRIIFPLALTSYAACLIILAANFEEKNA